MSDDNVIASQIINQGGDRTKARAGTIHRNPVSDDSSAIPPALSAEEWAHEMPTSLHSPDTAILFAIGHVVMSEEWRERRERIGPAMIALLNAALPDDDPRKITPDDISMLRQLITFIPDGVGLGDDPNGGRRWLKGFAAKLASYLPPR